MTPFESSHKSQMRGISRLNVPRGPDTESEDATLTGTIVTDIIEARPGAPKFNRPENRRSRFTFPGGKGDVS